MRRWVTKLARFSYLLFLLCFMVAPTGRAQDAPAKILKPGTVGTPYPDAGEIKAEGGLAPFTWHLSGGQLPPGLSVSPEGKISGTPATAASQPFTFEMTVSDSSRPPQMAAQHFSIVIGAAPLRIVRSTNATGSAPLKIVGANPLQEKVTPETASAAAASVETPPSGSTHPAHASPGVANDVGGIMSAGTSQPATPGNQSATPNDPPCSDNSDPPCVEGILHQWDYVVTGKMHTQSADSRVTIEVQVNDKPVNLSDEGVAAQRTVIDKNKGRFSVWLTSGLAKDQTVQVRQVLNGMPGAWSAPVTVAGLDPNDLEACVRVILDCRGTFEASTYLGLAIDTFASGDTRKYLNPNAPSGPLERMVGGIDFGYRLVGQPLLRSEVLHWAWANQLWVYGETVHGVRSSDIDCSKNPTFLTCQTALAIPGRAADQILYTFRNATSLEGFAGLRYEFLTLQPRSLSPANLYVKAQAGFLTVSGTAGAAKAVHHVGLGAVATKGGFQDSYLEFGFGRNDLFAEHRLSRWKVDAYLSKALSNGVSFFVQMTVDTDIGPGADSIQSFLGFNFDLKRIKDWFTPKQ
jgi:hypothetical protein